MLSVEWVAVLVAIVAVGVTITAAVVTGFRRLNDRIDAGLSEAAQERAAGFADAAQERAAGFADAAQERAAGFADAAQKRATGFADAARERAEIRERLARLEGTLDVLRSYFAPRQHDEGAA